MSRQEGDLIFTNSCRTKRVSNFIHAKVGCDQAMQRERHQSLEDFESISEQLQNHNPGVIPHNTM